MTVMPGSWMVLTWGKTINKQTNKRDTSWPFYLTVQNIISGWRLEANLCWVSCVVSCPRENWSVTKTSNKASIAFYLIVFVISFCFRGTFKQQGRERVCSTVEWSWLLPSQRFISLFLWNNGNSTILVSQQNVEDSLAYTKENAFAHSPKDEKSEDK